MIDLAGRTFGKYRIIGEVGRGGMAAVYKAVDTTLGRTVAVKVLPPQLGVDADPLKRFHREAQLAARLDHPGIVPIYDVDEQDGLHYIAMKFLEGENLHDTIEAHGALPPARAIDILRQIASAMDYAHAQGIIHRDIKPSNVIVGPDGHATLTDFGIARAVVGARITRHSTTIGTPGYMSPEQIDGAELDYRSDLFSLAVTAYEMLTGRAAYAGATPEAVLRARFTTEPASPSSVRPGLARGLDGVMRKAMARAPAERYPNAAAFVADLDRALSGEVAAPIAVPVARGTVVTQRSPDQPRAAKGNAAAKYIPAAIVVGVVWFVVVLAMSAQMPAPAVTPAPTPTLLAQGTATAVAYLPPTSTATARALPSATTASTATGTPTRTPVSVPSATPTVAPSATRAPTSAAAASPVAVVPTPVTGGRWTLVSDSLRDFPANPIDRHWWYVWSDGRFNFRFKDMMNPNGPGCAKPPNDKPIVICADRAQTDTSSDIALMWQPRQTEGGRYLLEWSSQTVAGDGAVLPYRQTGAISSQGAGPTMPNSYIAENMSEWEPLLLVIRCNYRPYETLLQARVYRWTP